MSLLFRVRVLKISIILTGILLVTLRYFISSYSKLLPYTENVDLLTETSS
jgi:hypothetical protein